MGTPRKIVVDGERLMWTRRSRSEAAFTEVVRVWRAERGGARLVIPFVDQPGAVATAGQGWGGHEGGLLVDRRYYNLNRPAVVAALVRQAMLEGWDPDGTGEQPMEGYALLRRSSAPPG